MKVKFRGVNNRCREIVKRYRKSSKDTRVFPEFRIGCPANDAGGRATPGKEPAEKLFILINLSSVDR